MALAKWCDRYKKLYISKGIKINDQLVNTLITAEQDIANSGYLRKQTFDICPECLKEFKDWISRGCFRDQIAKKEEI